MKRVVIFAFLAVADFVRRIMMRQEKAFGLLFLSSLSGFRERVGQWKAWRAFENANRNCPAYKDFLEKHPESRVILRGWTPDFSAVPSMDKKNYINTYSTETNSMREQIFTRLTEVNQDFRESIRMVPAGHEPTIEFHNKNQGPFAANDIRVKCR